MTTRTRTYECMCLLDNREVRKGWEPLKEAVSGLFAKHDAKVLSNRRWDERRLAYPIKGQNRATYLLVYFSTVTDQIPALRRELEFSEAMIRYMITECDDVPADAYEPEAEFDVDAIPEDDAPEVEEEAPAEEAKSEGDDKAKAEADGDDKGEGEAEASTEGDAKAEGADAAKADGDADAAKADGDAAEAKKEDQ